MNDRELKSMIRASRPLPRDGFAERIDCELVRLQSGKDENIMKRKIPLAALVALMVALLTAVGAIAATVINNRLRQELSDGGADDVAALVQDVNMERSDDGFVFAVDQCYWEGSDICLSYHAAVPDDGREYLLGLEIPTLNGHRLSYSSGLYMNNELDGYVLVLGGERMTTVSEVLRLNVYDAQVLESGNTVAFRANFMTPRREIRWVTRAEYEALLRAEGEYRPAVWDDRYFYVDREKPVPSLTLSELMPVQELWASMELSEWITPENDEAIDRYGRLTAEQLEAAELATLEKRFEIEIDADGARYEGPVYRGVRERTLQFRNFTVEIEGFTLSHLYCGVDMIVRPDDGAEINEIPTDFGLYLPDGTPLCRDESGSYMSGFGWKGGQDADGRPSYINLHLDLSGVLAVGSGETFLLVPMRYDAKEDRMTPDMDDAAVIAPTEAQFEDDPDGIWATEFGNYYHTDRYCMGMQNAQRTTAAEAEAAGKKRCIVCMK